MCGILCLVGNGDYGADLSDISVSGQSAVFKQWIARDEHVELSDEMRSKLDNVERVRETSQRLKAVRNDIKGRFKAEREALEAQLAALQVASEYTEQSNLSPSTSAVLVLSVEQFKYLEATIAARGPDYVERQVQGKYVLFSSILSLRQPFKPQPTTTSNGFILQFNGELYNEQCLESCDTTYIATELSQIPQEGRNDAIRRLLNLLQGEFAVNIIDVENDVVYFARDLVGKRSLLYKHDNGTLLISSVAYDNTWIECQNRIYIYSGGEDVTSYPYEEIAPVETPNSEGQELHVLETALRKAVSLRTSTIHPRVETPSTLAILFSGGLDCTVLAYLIADSLRKTTHQIDLLTVGFDNPRINQTASTSPDRILARKSWTHLSQMFAEDPVVINLVEIDVTYSQWLMHKERVARLMMPNNTEMDLSIAIAFYFASNCRYDCRKTWMKGDQELHDNTYKSSASVLFSGLGADELFGGYSRHEAIFQDISQMASEEYGKEDNHLIDQMYETLHASLSHDVDVIHQRNLGRDDRVIACWGKEVRYPYLDPEFIGVAMGLDARHKITYEWKTVVTKKCPQGKRVLQFERKHILRELAGRLGLEWVQHELKRAIQFGAKSAKLEIGQSKTRGTDTI